MIGNACAPWSGATATAATASMPPIVNSTLRRKIGQSPPNRPGDRVTPARAFEQAVAHAGLDALRHRIAATALAEAPVTLAEMGALLSDTALGLVLETGGAARGLIVLDQECLRAIVKILTTGILSGTDDTARAPTMTDHALCRDFAAKLVAAFVTRLAGHPVVAGVHGLTPGVRLTGAGHMSTVLAASRYRSFSATIEFDGGAVTGGLSMTVPWDLSQPAPPSKNPADETRHWTSAMQTRVLDSPVRLDAVLHRLEVPLSRVAAMQPGDCLPLPSRVLHEVMLETADGVPIGLWHLGQAHGYRALRLVSPECRRELLRVINPPPADDEATKPAHDGQDRRSAEDRILPVMD